MQRLLATERLVTIVGVGGVGKTRLAFDVARRAETATVLLLASVSDPEGVPHALAAALGLREVRGNVLAACAAFVDTRPHLLVVDNCEHLLGAAADVVAALLNRCAGLTVLATSREPLGSPVECAFRLAPLPLPRPGSLHELDPHRLAAVPSVAVFLERAARVRPGFAPGPDEVRLIGDLVRRLDGIPLAIELAAGRLSTFSLADLAERLDRALDLLGSGRAASEARHRTLRSTLEWSYQLLDPPARLLFRHLSMFADGVDLTTTEAIAADLGLTDDPGGTLTQPR